MTVAAQTPCDGRPARARLAAISRELGRNGRGLSIWRAVVCGHTSTRTCDFAVLNCVRILKKVSGNYVRIFNIHTQARYLEYNGSARPRARRRRGPAARGARRPRSCCSLVGEAQRGGILPRRQFFRSASYSTSRLAQNSARSALSLAAAHPAATGPRRARGSSSLPQRPRLAPRRGDAAAPSDWQN